MGWITRPALPLSVADGGTGQNGSPPPSLIAGAGIVVAGAWPNQTVSASAGGTYAEVANFAALPPAAAHTNEIYVVLASSGVYFINRKSAGFYVSDGVNWTLIGDLTEAYFNDANLEFFDDADPTKIARIDCAGIATGTTRTFAFPDQSGTLALLADIPAPGISSVGAVAPLASSGGLTPSISLTGVVPIANGGNGTATPALVPGANIAIGGTWPSQSIAFDGILPVANGGSGTATPGLIAGTNITITGAWPNQTINASGGGGSATIERLTVNVPSASLLYETTAAVASVTPTSKLIASLVWDGDDDENGTEELENMTVVAYPASAGNVTITLSSRVGFFIGDFKINLLVG